MTTQARYLEIALGPSDQDLQDALYKPVDISGTVAATTAATVGVLQTKVPSGYNFTCAYLGQVKMLAGAAINSGTSVGVTTSGYILTATNSTYLGRTIGQASSGDLVEVLINAIPR